LDALEKIRIEKERLARRDVQHGRGGRQMEENERQSLESQRDRQRVRELELRFKDYKPEVKLEYHDEFGRQLNQKEVSTKEGKKCVFFFLFFEDTS